VLCSFLHNRVTTLGALLPFQNLKPAALRWANDQRTLLLIYVVAALVVSIQRGAFGFPNDYAIFRASFWNLLANRDLYVLRLDQAHDYFKYSPSFALLFAPFAVLPFVAGLFLWNAVNAVSVFFSLRLLLPREQWAIAQWLVFLPALRSIQSAQSNALVAALIVVAFVCFERGRLWRAATAIALGTVIKIFPAVAIIFALPRRDRTRALLATVVITAVLIALPLIVVSPGGLAAQYSSWSALERSEAGLVGASAMALLRDVGINLPPWPVQLVASAILIGMLIVRVRDWDDRAFRLRFLGFVLVFCVAFNHRAERQSVVIAMSGMVIWYLASPRAAWRSALFVIVYFLVVVSGTDVVPGAMKHILGADVRLPLPLTILWLVMLGELAVVRSGRQAVAEAG
jgi:hypothetical protein